MKTNVSKISRIFNRLLVVFLGLGLVIFSSCHKDPIDPEDPITPLYGVKAEKYKEMQIMGNTNIDETALEIQNSKLNE